MQYDAVVHMRLNQKQLNFIEEKARETGVNKSTVVRQMIDKAMKKNGKSKA